MKRYKINVGEEGLGVGSLCLIDMDALRKSGDRLYNSEMRKEKYDGLIGKIVHQGTYNYVVSFSRHHGVYRKYHVIKAEDTKYEEI